MFRINPILLSDAYKVSHPLQYPPKTEYVYSNITPRSSRLPGVNEVVVFGIQYFIKRYLMDEFNNNFFSRTKDEVLAELTEFFDDFFGPGAIDVTRYGELHDLGYLPLTIKALPEGVKCPTGVPFCTIVNTLPEFYWLTNAVETLSQCTIWNPLVAATISNRNRETLDKFAQETSSQEQMTAFQAHNFSMRGMSSVESAITTDLGHLLSSAGTDTLPGVVAAKYFYGAEPGKNLVGCSIPATEHSVACAGAAIFPHDNVEEEWNGSEWVPIRYF